MELGAEFRVETTVVDDPELGLDASKYAGVLDHLGSSKIGGTENPQYSSQLG